MADLITTAEFEAREGRSFETGSAELAQLEATITDASALVVEVIIGDSSITDSWTAGNVPGSVVPIVTRMVRRALDNPHGFDSERTFEYQYGGASGDGIVATRSEARALRRAAGRSQLVGVNLEGYWPAPDRSSSSGGDSWLDGAIG